MDWLRKIVSGKRRRYTDDSYNLDVTYITDRVLAMSFPASGLETMYRNNMADVRIAHLWLSGGLIPKGETRQELHGLQHERPHL